MQAQGAGGFIPVEPKLRYQPVDLVSANIGEPNFVYLGDGTGAYGDGTAFGGSSRTFALAVADLAPLAEIAVGDGAVEAAVEVLNKRLAKAGL